MVEDLPVIERCYPSLVHRGVFPPPVPAHNWPRTGTAGACDHLPVEVESAGKGILGGSLERCVLAYTLGIVYHW